MMSKQNAAAVDYEERDSDGYWIYLKAGWRLKGENTHAITETTKRGARAKLCDVVPCRCSECQQG
jgi:hypothetical protein